MISSFKRFLAPFGILLAALVGYNALIHFSVGQTQRHQLLLTLERLPPGTDCIFLGNSLVEAGCDVNAFNSGWPDQPNSPIPVNLALGGTSPVEHYLILKKALEQPLRLKYVIYGFFDDQLSAPVRGGWSELVGNRAFSYYFPKEAAAFYAPGSATEVWWLRLIGNIPMLSERSSVWSKIELLRRYLEEIGMPKQKSNRFGRVQDFAALEPKDLAWFNERCEVVLREQKGFSKPVREIMRLAQEHGAKVIFVEMPLPSRHRQTFYSSPVWSRMRRYLQSQTSQQQAAYIPASDWIQDDNAFEDATHLTQQAAQVFSRKLAVALGSKVE